MTILDMYLVIQILRSDYKIYAYVSPVSCLLERMCCRTANSFVLVNFQSSNLLIFFIASGLGLSPLHCGHFWPIVPAPDDKWGWLWSNWWNEDWQGKPKYSEKICPSATLSTTNTTWPDPGSNPGRRGGKPATNCLSYGAASTGAYYNTWASSFHVPDFIPFFIRHEIFFCFLVCSMAIVHCIAKPVAQAAQSDKRQSYRWHNRNDHMERYVLQFAEEGSF
jgi:hypothetical protein